MERYIIGIDSGTSGVKAVLFDLDGNEIRKKGFPIEAYTPFENWFEEDMDEILEKTFDAIRYVVKPFSQSAIIGIGVTAQGDGLWLIDGDGRPVRKGVCFCDGRAGEIVKEWEQSGVTEEVFRISGTRLFTGNQPGVLKWMELHEGDVLQKAKYAMHLKDYLYMKLTGDVLTDVSDQSLVFLDIKNRAYDKRLFDLYSLSAYMDKYPKVLECEETKAYLSEDAALALGLTRDVVVTNGPMDVAACALGAGVTEVGQCCSIIGTAALHEMVIDNPADDEIYAGMTVCHAMKDRWLRLMASLAGTPNIEWLFGVLGEALQFKASANGQDVYAYAEGLIETIPVGANGLLFHPYLLAGGERAPFIEPAARASFTGLSANHSMGDLLRACYEGVAYAMMDCYLNMPREVKSITLCGGGAKSELWCRMFADAVGRDVITVGGEELGAKGCFITNAYAQGIFGSYADGVSKTVKPGRTYRADQSKHARYLEYYELYKQTYTALTDTWRARQDIVFGGG